MILLGAGSSVPFGIPAMRKFVKDFRKTVLEDAQATNLNDLLRQIESALDSSGKLVGVDISFDLESLMVVLQDLVATKGKPISAPTFALMLHFMIQKRMEVGAYNIENVRQTFGKRAHDLLDRLRKFVFETCMSPIEIGQEEGSFSFFDLFYGYLFALLGNGDFRSPRTQWIFTTNWDTCHKQWLDYAMRDIAVEDGTTLDRHRNQVFSPATGWSKDSNNVNRKIVPLHGSLDLIRRSKFILGGTYEEIHKVTAAETYFKGNPTEINKAFMIFPLEAVGYEESVRSPYLDMLNLLKNRLSAENDVYVIGFSFRDPTIASIFEEVLRERAQKGDWEPIPDEETLNLTEEEKKRFKAMRMRVFLIDSSPETVIDYLAERGYLNLARALIPVKASFPEVIGHKQVDLEPLKKDLNKLFSEIFDKLNKCGLDLDWPSIKERLMKFGLEFPA